MRNSGTRKQSTIKPRLTIRYYAVVMLGLLLAAAATAGTVRSGDAYIKTDGTNWTLGTGSVERIIALENGSLLLKSFKNKATGHQLSPQNGLAEEFSFSLNEPANRIGSTAKNWKLVSNNVTKLNQGELQLDICLERESLQLTKSYVVYPKSNIIREWVTFKNAGTAPLKIIEPAFLKLSTACGNPASLDFCWITGGWNYLGSWVLHREQLNAAKPRLFDSYDAIKAEKVTNLMGDGINAKIMLNDKQLWPNEGWKYVSDASVTENFDIAADVKAGDRLLFIVNMNKNIGWDTTSFDPAITYDDDGQTHTASKEFSGEQGKNNWRYQYIEEGKFIDMVYYPDVNKWKKEKDNPTGTPFISPIEQHPDNGQDVVRVWTAPKDGKVRISGSVCNTGNGAGGTGYGTKPGTSTYAPWYGLFSKETKEGIFIGWDYFGHWTSSFNLAAGGIVTSQLNIAGHNQTLTAGQSFTTPKSFVGIFNDDLDNAGNECLDWQYRYMWDYTREGWFPAIRMLGYWFKGTGWGKEGVGWSGGKPDLDSTFRKIFRVADLMRYCGADVYHRDWGWWDCAGDWNGPDFRTTINYLKKYDMGQLIYAFIYTVDPKSQVARNHPDWLLEGGTLDMSRPEVVAHLKHQLDEFVERWGDFEWRNDSGFTAPAKNGDNTCMLAQDQGLRDILKSFLDKYPKCAFQAVNGGGNYGGYDYVRYASTFSFSDGAVGIIRNYYASLMFPPDKTSDIPDIWNPNDYDKAVWRGLLCINFDMTGDTWDPAKLEGLRELIDIYHYLYANGVVGRWVKVYRPAVTGDDPTMYFQRLSGDRLRGIIIPKHPATAPVTIKPKGLIQDKTYLVSFHESEKMDKRKGSELMQQGITIEKMPAGELIYLNLPMHPGSKLDTKSPVAPKNITKCIGENMGYPGVEIKWKAGKDNNWISYYEIFRNGVSIDKVAKGTFYFDHSAGADPSADYQVRTVDGAGNVSQKAVASGPAAKPYRIFDDGGSDIKFTGNWQHLAKLQPAYEGTISFASEKPAAADLAFDGRKILLFGKLGADCGKAEISIDNSTPEIIDTYSADDIWGVCIYKKELPASGKHTLHIAVTGTKSGENLVYIDGIRVEQ